MFNGWQLLTAAVLVLAAPTSALAARGYATASVNMRAGPGTDYPVVTTIPDNARLNIHGCLSDHDWCDVTWRDNRGWVSANYLDYFYGGRYVHLPSYVEQIDVPVVTFALAPYWNSYYKGRPWYGRLGHWQNVWRTHGRYGHLRHEGGHRHAGVPGRPHGPVGSVVRGETGARGVPHPHVRGHRFAHGQFGNRAGHARIGHAGDHHGGTHFREARAPHFRGHHGHARLGGHHGIARHGNAPHFGGRTGGAPHVGLGRHGGGPAVAAHGGGAHFRGGHFGARGGHGRGAAMGAHAQMGGGGPRGHHRH